MRQLPSLRPTIYIDPSVIEDALLGRMRPRDRAAVYRIAAMVSENVLSFYCPAQARAMIGRVSPEQRQQHAREYLAVAVLCDAEQGWLGEDAAAATADERDVEALVSLLGERSGARHIVYARAAGVRDLVAAESSRLVSKATDVEAGFGLRVFRPADYLSRWSIQQPLRS